MARATNSCTPRELTNARSALVGVAETGGGRALKERGTLSLMTFAALLVTQKRDKRKVTLCLFIKKLLIRHAPRATFLAAARSRSGSDSPRAVIHSPRAASLPAGEGWRKSLLSSAHKIPHARPAFIAGVQTMRARICSASSCAMFARVV